VAPTDVSSQVELAARLREGELSVAPQVVNLLESSAAADRERAKALLGELSPRALGREPAGQIVGVTGPPGAGKSTLLAALIAELRRRGERGVAVLAVDPSSRLSGGSLLGDRLRIALPNPDPAVFIRSLAAGGRHGGLARGVRESAEALAVAFPWVVIETVGVGQGETEVAEVADTVCLVVQPASGDTLQFLKAGIMEVPDLFVVTKADLREQARRTTLELQAALKTLGRGEIPVVGVRSTGWPMSSSSGGSSCLQTAAGRLPSAGLPAGDWGRSPPSCATTASLGCASSAVGARPSGCWSGATPPPRSPSWSVRSSGRLARATGVAAAELGLPISSAGGDRLLHHPRPFALPRA